MHVFALALVLAQHNIFDSIAHNAHAKVGVSAWVIETNQRIGFRENERFDTESTYKLPICMAVLRKVSLAAKVDVRKQDMFPGQYSPLRDEYPNGHTFTVEELVRYTITLSDNTAADVLKHLAIAVFLNKARGDQKARDRVIAEIARKAYDWGCRVVATSLRSSQ